MLGLIAGVLATVIAASPLMAERSSTSVDPNQVVASPQDVDALLKCLERLAARVAKLENEIGRLEATHKQLKEQLQPKAAGGGVPAPGAALPPGAWLPPQLRTENPPRTEK